MFIGRTTCNPSLALGPYEDWRGFINGTIPIPSYWAHTGYIQIDSSYNRWQRRICTLSVQLYSYVTSVCNSVFVSDKIINNSDNFRIKCLFYNKISVILCVLYFYAFLFNLWKYVILREKISFSFFIFDTCDVVYNCPFLCCHLLYFIIYLVISRLRVRVRTEGVTIYLYT